MPQDKWQHRGAEGWRSNESAGGQTAPIAQTFHTVKKDVATYRIDHTAPGFRQHWLVSAS